PTAPVFAPPPLDVVAASASATLPAMPAPSAPPPRLVTSPEPNGEAAIFSMDGLMRVMGKDAKGRATVFKMVRGALDSGMDPVDQAGVALREGRLRDAARLFHGLRGAVGVLGAKRLIQATLAAEEAIHEQRIDEFDLRLQTVRAELAQTLTQARAWLDRQPA
ncbi:Hpt domain-containing protein, partial [Duganella callida]